MNSKSNFKTLFVRMMNLKTYYKKLRGRLTDLDSIQVFIDVRFYFYKLFL